MRYNHLELCHGGNSTSDRFIRSPLHDLDIREDLYGLDYGPGWEPYDLHDLENVSNDLENVSRVG